MKLEGARCSPETADLFFDSSKIDEARKLCRDCPAQTECLEAALDILVQMDDRYGLTGVWGGKGPKQLRAIARKRGLI